MIHGNFPSLLARQFFHFLCTLLFVLLATNSSIFTWLCHHTTLVFLRIKEERIKKCIAWLINNYRMPFKKGNAIAVFQCIDARRKKSIREHINLIMSFNFSLHDISLSLTKSKYSPIQLRGSTCISTISKFANTIDVNIDGTFFFKIDFFGYCGY